VSRDLAHSKGQLGALRIHDSGSPAGTKGASLSPKASSVLQFTVSMGEKNETTGNKGGLIFSACAGDETEHDSWETRKLPLPCGEILAKDMATSRDYSPSAQAI
jgi:hypothetical protein